MHTRTPARSAFGLIVVLLFALLASACLPTPMPGAVASVGLAAWLDQPANGAELPLGAFTLKAHARDTGGSGVINIVFLVSALGGSGPVAVGSVATDPSLPLVEGAVEWNPSVPGVYFIQAKADNAAGYVFSEAARVCVGRDLLPEGCEGLPAGPVEGPTGKVEGTVLGDDGDGALGGADLPLDGALVTVSGCLAGSATTGADGRFSVVGGLAGDPCALTVAKAGWTFALSTYGTAYPVPATAEADVQILMVKDGTDVTPTKTPPGQASATKTPPGQPSATKTPPGQATATKTPVPLATATRTQPAALPSATATPTLVVSVPSDTPKPTDTLVPPTATNTQPPADTTGPNLKVNAPSANPVYYTTGCGPNKLTVSVDADDPSGLGAVSLQYRYRNGDGSVLGPWRNVGANFTGGINYASTLDLGSPAEALADLGGANGNVEYVFSATDSLGNGSSTGAGLVGLLYCPG